MNMKIIKVVDDEEKKKITKIKHIFRKMNLEMILDSKKFSLALNDYFVGKRI